MAKPEEMKATYENDACPVPPAEPLPEQCCGNGCEVCIYDTYNAALRQYRLDKAAWDVLQVKQDKSNA